MKKLSFLLITLLALSLTLLMASCGAPDEIKLDEKSMPQTTFVLGQDLDLTGGILLVRDGDETLKVDLTSEEVTVLGYDKNQLGTQTLTVMYGKKASTTFDVTVVPRMTAVDFTTDYLVGDSLTLTAGRLKITRNDGSNFTVAFNSTKVTVTGFDSSTTGEKTLTAKYTSNNETYTADFKVNVHAVDNVILTNPTKVTYKSHDEAIDVTGGFLTYKGMNGLLERNVRLEPEMTSGFDLSSVTADPATQTQTITVNYDNRTFTYEIKITYTSVSDFKDHAKLLADLDFTGEEAPEITDAQGAEAIRIMELYLDMSPADQALIDADETVVVLDVARAALVYAFDKWSTDLLTFQDAFGVEYGSLTFYCETEQALENAIVGLQNEDRPLYQYSEIMALLVEAYEEEVVYGEMYFMYYPVIENEVYPELANMFQYMLDLDALMDEIPANWRDNDVNTYADEIEAVFDFIVEGDYYSYSYTTIFYLTSAFREDDDAFDFLYTYYYGLLGSDDEDIASKGLGGIFSLANVRLPAELEEIFSYIMMAMELIETMSDYYNLYFTHEIYDTTQLFYAYHMAEDLTNELLNKLNIEEGETLSAEDEMLLTLFYYLPLNGMLGVSTDEGTYYFLDMLEYLRTVEGGYYYYAGALYGVPAYEALMAKYMNILTLWNTDETYQESAAFATDIEEMMALFMALESSQKFNFLGSISLFFSTMNIPPLAFDTAEDSNYAYYETLFVYLLRIHYQSLFTSEDAKAAYVDLMIAVELFSQRYTNGEWYDSFTAKLESVRDAYTHMNAADKAVFEQKLLAILEEYEDLADLFSEDAAEEEVDFGAWQDQFQALYDALALTEFAYSLIYENNYFYFSFFFTAFERAMAISEDILKNAPPEIVDLYRYTGLYESSEVLLSFEYMIGLYRSVYVSLLNTDMMGYSVYDYYVDGGLKEFMNLAYDVIWPYLLSEEGATGVFDKASVLAAITAFHGLDTESQILFYLYLEDIAGEYVGYYLTALESFLVEEYTLTAAQLAYDLINLEISYIVYDKIGDADSLASLIEELAYVKNAYEALAGEDKESFTDFEDDYSLLVSMIEKAIEKAQQTPAEESVA